MAKVESYVCDVCGAVKGEKNHWFRMVIDEDTGLWMKEWSGTMFDNKGNFAPHLHLCSDECVTRKVQQFLSEKQNETAVKSF